MGAILFSPKFVSIAGLMACLFSGVVFPPSQDDASNAQQETTKPALKSTDEADQKLEDEKTDEKLFENWADPEFCLFVGGRLHGYIEPCGCTGLSTQKGGLMRRDAVRRQLIEKGWNLVCVDSGNQIRRFGAQPFVKLQTIWQSLTNVLKFDAIAFGPDDLKTSGTDLLQAMGSAMVDENPRFVGANVQWIDTDGLAVDHRIVKVGKRKVGITAVLGNEFKGKYAEDTFKILDTDEALAKVWPKMKAQRCDVNVIVVWATDTEECIRIAKKFPHFDVLISTAGGGEPTQLPEQIKVGNHVTSMIQTGTKGMYVGVVGFFPVEAGLQLRYQRVPLDGRFEDSEEMKVVFKKYQEELEIYGLDGLGIKPVDLGNKRKYVGSLACKECHPDAYDVWKNGIDGKGGPHFKATKDLTDPSERVWVKRHHDPECLSCHVTGWNPQDYYPYKTGYLKLEDELLHGNGCENCHGPGSVHIDAENGVIPAKDEYLEDMRLTLEEAKETQCFTCHDIDNSPDFKFDEYWEKIKHYEDD